MLKRVATLLFLTLLLIMSVGIWLLFPLLQGYYRVKAHHAIEYQHSELVTLRLKSSEFRRVGNTGAPICVPMTIVYSLSNLSTNESL